MPSRILAKKTSAGDFVGPGVVLSTPIRVKVLGFARIVGEIMQFVPWISGLPNMFPGSDRAVLVKQAAVGMGTRRVWGETFDNSWSLN